MMNFEAPQKVDVLFIIRFEKRVRYCTRALKKKPFLVLLASIKSSSDISMIYHKVQTALA